MSQRPVRVTIILASLLLFSLTFAGIFSAPVRGAADATGVIAFKRGHQIRTVNSDGTGDQPLWTEPLPDSTFRGIRGLQWRPDGGALAFASDYQQLCSIYESDIYTINANGSGLKRLTNSPACAGLGGFPKGTVRVEVENGTAESEFLFYVEGAPTAKMVNINPGAAVIITFTDVADLGDVQQQIVAINGRFRWFDAGVFVNVRPGQSTDASTRLILTGSNMYRNLGGTAPTWHRSGTKAGFLFYEGIMMQIGANPPVSGDDSFILDQNMAGVIADNMTWSPKSDWLLYSSSNHISVIQPGAQDAGEPIIDKGATEIVSGLDWLPDESGFVFAITGGQFGSENSNIYLFDFEENSLTPLTNYDDKFAGALSVSPNGQQIVFEFANNLGDPPQLRIMDIDGGNNRSLGIQGEMPDWKPGTGIDYSHHVMLPVVMDR